MTFSSSCWQGVENIRSHEQDVEIGLEVMNIWILYIGIVEIMKKKM